ncbi:MAG TPA: hydroxyacylglutathione hydrolase, partial [Myxococcota bacterium]|nr:hydroxyacylglutathione hydrolase [Myxococcota bacterium]
MGQEIEVEALPCLRDNYAWLVRCGATGESALVDACEPALAGRVVERVGRSSRLGAVWSTHHHWDHVGGNAAVVEAFPGVPVLGHTSDRGRLPGLTEGLEDGARFRLGALEVEVMHVPGHTLGAVAYVVRGEREVAVFTGDTLFSAGCGRLFEGTPAMMFASVSRLAALPDETRVYCGHEYTASNLAFARHLEPGSVAIAKRMAEVDALRAKGLPSLPSTIAIEKETNPFLRSGSVELR